MVWKTHRASSLHLLSVHVVVEFFFGYTSDSNLIYIYPVPSQTSSLRSQLWTGDETISCNTVIHLPHSFGSGSCFGFTSVSEGFLPLALLGFSKLIPSLTSTGIEDSVVVVVVVVVGDVMGTVYFQHLSHFSPRGGVKCTWTCSSWRVRVSEYVHSPCASVGLLVTMETCDTPK